MLKWLLKSLLILAVFVPFGAALPVAALCLCRTPDGAQFLFWTIFVPARIVYAQELATEKLFRCGAAYVKS